MTGPYDILVGIDWATRSHQVCLLSPDGEVLEEACVDHSAEKVHGFIAGLLRRVNGDAHRVAVAIEIPRGPLVETLLERGIRVYTLNPKQVDRFRDRHSVAGAKDDRLDARVLADALRTDLHKFRPVELDEPLIIQIREISRADEDLREEVNRLVNRLREQVQRCAPHLLCLCPAADEPWFWDLVERFTTPGARVTRHQAQKLLARHRIRRLSAEAILSTLNEERLWIAPGAAEATRSHILLLLPRLRMAHEQRKACARHLKSLLAEYAEDEDRASPPNDVALLLSLPGVGPVVSATLLAEAAPLLATRNYHAVRALGGLASVTRRSGRSHVVIMRRGCNSRLRNAFYHWTRTSIQHDAAAKRYYAGLRARGHSHGRALRSVADRWLRILMAMLTSATLYEARQPRREAAAA